MAVYRKKLVDKDGNTIIPAIGDIYGPVYTASLQSASGGVATYTFTPDTPVEASRVYAVKFPEPTVNNAVILLGDGTMTACSILLPPVAASDSPSYELAYTYNTNDTEVWLLMYNGVGQWICLNQRAELGLASTTLPSIAWDGGTIAGSSGFEGLVYADLVLINNAYIARSQTAWNTSWQNIGTLPEGYRPKTQTIFPAIFTNLDTGNVTGYGRVRFNISGVIDAKANATVSNAYCCFSGVFATK